MLNSEVRFFDCCLKKSAALTFLLEKKKKEKKSKAEEADGISRRKAVIAVCRVNACFFLA